MRNRMWIDFHTHILPGMDDGAQTVQQSIKMLRTLRDQGVECVALTPHYYPHRDSVDDFLKKRQAAFEELKKALGHEKMPKLLLGAEVAFECDMDNIDQPQRLCLEGTPYLMIELPIHYHYMPWMLESTLKMCSDHQILPMLAHVDRYIGIYSDDDVENMVSESGALIQVNVSSLLRASLRKRVLSWVKSGQPIVLGSDTHNTTSRKPRFHKGVKILSRRTSVSVTERIKADSQLVLRGGKPQNQQDIPLLIKER